MSGCLELAALTLPGETGRGGDPENGLRNRESLTKVPTRSLRQTQLGLLATGRTGERGNCEDGPSGAIIRVVSLVPRTGQTKLDRKNHTDRILALRREMCDCKA
jgi:hypothetical protein